MWRMRLMRLELRWRNGKRELSASKKIKSAELCDLVLLRLWLKAVNLDWKNQLGKGRSWRMLSSFTLISSVSQTTLQASLLRDSQSWRQRSACFSRLIRPLPIENGKGARRTLLTAWWSWVWRRLSWTWICHREEQGNCAGEVEGVSDGQRALRGVTLPPGQTGGTHRSPVTTGMASLNISRIASSSLSLCKSRSFPESARNLAILRRCCSRF
mmetsp:Transcript_41223/g.89858  ORF Transcript_41223/g.89858 Transcript_41223/m.89858 type:complete len:213 (+) Transcript_41223:503-1141(+)